jgi:flavin reductase (DIM6/NTAB) family NADH-FMN oxidoreductase RutF
MRYDTSDISPAKLHQILLGAISPRPIAFASTIDADGQPNLSPFSFFNAFGVNPTTLIFSPARRNRDATTKHTYENIKEIPEVVINVVTYDIVQQVSLASTEYARGVNEFEKAGFTQVASEKIRPFRVGESPVQFECRVRDVIETGEGGGSANLIICEVLLTHVNEQILDDKGMIDPEKIRLVGRMGGDYYCKAYGDGIFKVQKPIERLGIGIDRLPETIRLSRWINGNNLGKLGNVEHLPTAAEIAEMMQHDQFKMLNISYPLTNDKEEEIHLMAAKLLDNNMVHEAFCLLMATQTMI